MILSVSMKNQEATEKKRRIFQYIKRGDDTNKGNKISSVDNGKKAINWSIQTTINELLNRILEKKHVDKLQVFSILVQIHWIVWKNLSLLKRLNWLQNMDHVLSLYLIMILDRNIWNKK